jgi:hypothetical protein
MPRPEPYENLIKTGLLQPVTSDRTFVSQYLVNAQDYTTAATAASLPVARFTLAYEGFYCLVQAVLEHYGVRSTSRQGHRIVAIQRVCADLKLTPGQVKQVSDVHARRNESTYRAPIPPVSQAEADAMLAIVSMAMPQVVALTATVP